MNEKKQEIRLRYDSTANMYDNRYKNIQLQKYVETFAHIKLDHSDVIIDVGGGTGLLGDFLTNHHENLIICDLSFQMLKEGKKKRNSLQYICADSDYLPFRENCSNIVTCFSVIQNLPLPQITLKEICEILKNNGMLILSALKNKFSLEDLQVLLSNLPLNQKNTLNLSLEDYAIIAQKKNKIS